MTFIRKLGKNEQILASLNQLACTWNIVIVSRIKGNLTIDILSQAIKLVQQHHAILNYRIIGPLGNLYFDKIQCKPTVPIKVINNYIGSPWQGIVQEELNTKIDPSKYLLRFVVVYPSNEPNTTYLITTLHHAVSDGRSSIQLHAELLTYCQQIVSGTSISIENSLPILASVETFLPSWTKGIKGFCKSASFLFSLVLNNLRHRPDSLDFEKYLPIESRRCDVIHRKLDPKTTKTLISLCRKEKTTVHAAIFSAMILAFLKNIDFEERKRFSIHCQSAVDLRKRLKIPISNNQMGAFASLVRFCCFTGNNLSFWKLSRAINQKIETSLRWEEHFRMLLISDILFHYLRFYPRQVSTSIHVSNVGKVTIPQFYSPFHLEDISFVTSNRFYPGVFTAEITTFQEEMSLNFVFVPPLVNRNTMDELVEETITQILDICLEKHCILANIQ